MKISICIPTYDYNNKVEKFFDKLLKSIEIQTYKNIEIVICDQGPNYLSSKFILNNISILDNTKIILSKEKGSPLSTKLAVENCNGDWIKIMNVDDFFTHPNALKDMLDSLNSGEARWCVTACNHCDADEKDLNRLHQPQWPGERNMTEGVNLIGCPSVSMFHRSAKIDFLTGVMLCLDCSMWIQLYRQFGLPSFVRNPGVTIRMHSNQLSNQINYAQELERDKKIMRAKYGYD